MEVKYPGGTRVVTEIVNRRSVMDSDSRIAFKLTDELSIRNSHPVSQYETYSLTPSSYFLRRQFNVAN